jgi:hypothetical protein
MAGTDDIERGGFAGAHQERHLQIESDTCGRKATPHARQSDGFSSKATLRGRKVTDFARLLLNRVNSVNTLGYRAVRVG